METNDDALAKIRAGAADFRKRVGRANIGLFTAAACLLAAPRLIVSRAAAKPAAEVLANLQLPWLPTWPGLVAAPLHDPLNHPWTRRLRQAAPEIREELASVRGAFARARYDSSDNEKPWTTFYFYLEGRPCRENLSSCPRTAAVLQSIPHNAFHVCFSALEPGGSLHLHTGPTNASLTAHLGLENCSGARLSVANRTAEYRDDEVLVFDDSFVHGVGNFSSAVRYTLMVTFWHPQLTYFERAFLRQVIRRAP